MSLRRLIVPLSLSVALHGLFVGLAWLLPSSARPFSGESGDSTSLRVSIAFSRPRAPRPAEASTLPHDLEPVVSIPAGPGIAIDPPSFPTAPVSSDPPAPGGASTGSRTLLTAPATARRIVYLLDCSVSMGPSGALKRGIEEVLAASNRLSPEASFQIIPYNRVALPLLPGWQRPDAATLAEVENKLLALRATDGTHHAQALNKALASQPDLIFLVTDAEELTFADVRAITRRNQGRAVIHVVELARGRAERFDSLLSQLAANNGGTHRRVSPDF